MKVLVKLKNDIVKHPWVYLMFLPVAAFYILFCYVPMGGAVIAFNDYSPRAGIFGSEWVSNGSLNSSATSISSA